MYEELGHETHVSACFLGKRLQRKADRCRASLLPLSFNKAQDSLSCVVQEKLRELRKWLSL